MSCALCEEVGHCPYHCPECGTNLYPTPEPEEVQYHGPHFFEDGQACDFAGTHVHAFTPNPVPDITSKGDSSHEGGTPTRMDYYGWEHESLIDEVLDQQARISSLEEEREELRKAARELADLSATVPAFLTDAAFHAAAYTVHALLGDSHE